jgi:hypothetical protein
MRISLLSALVFAASTSLALGASDSLRHTSSASEHSYGGSTTMAVGVSDTQTITAGESATALFSVGQNWVQTYLAIYTTKGNFDFAVGGAYKFTVAGTRATGFHIGPGFTVGTVANDFAFAFFGAAGGHYTFAEHLLFSVDAGPMVTHTANNTNFRLRGFGPVLGLTIAYVF